MLLILRDSTRSSKKSGYPKNVLSLLLLAATSNLNTMTAMAWVPPPRDRRQEFESVHAMRRRLGQPFNYSTTFVDAEMCRYLSQDQCQESEAMMRKHVDAHKSLQKQIQQNPNLGDINVLVLMVRFADHTDRDCKNSCYCFLIFDCYVVPCIVWYYLSFFLLESLLKYLLFSLFRMVVIPKQDIDEFWKTKVPEWLVGLVACLFVCLFLLVCCRELDWDTVQ
jgi:hypothetical protein